MIPDSEYDNPVVRQAVDDRTVCFERKAGELCSLRIYYVILYEGTAHHRSITGAIARLVSEPKKGPEGLRGFLSGEKQTLTCVSAPFLRLTLAACMLDVIYVTSTL